MSALRERTVKWTYGTVFVALLVLGSPLLLLKLLRRGHWRSQFGQRFGRFEDRARQALADQRVLWLHAVSVGEVNLVVRLVSALTARCPPLKLVVSTTTSTGMGELRRRLPEGVEKVYFPLDHGAWVRRWLAVVRPRAAVLVEAEIWPNLLWALRDQGVPVALVNARISARSAGRYRRLGFVFRELFASFKLVCCASGVEARSLVEAGCRPEAVVTVGNLKFDAALPAEDPRPDVRPFLDCAGAVAGAPILLGGSTHPGEERVLGEILLQLRPRYADLFLVVVPRHFERAPDAVRDLQQLGLRVALRSRMQDPAAKPADRADVLVVDSTGELRSFYEHATVVFMGKSLTVQGGQNPIEPAALGRAIITGPHMQNFQRIMEDLRGQGAVLQVPDAVGLQAAVDRLLGDPRRREELAGRAREAVAAGSGALGRTVDELLKCLAAAGLHDGQDHPAPGG